MKTSVSFSLHRLLCLIACLGLLNDPLQSQETTPAPPDTAPAPAPAPEPDPPAPEPPEVEDEEFEVIPVERSIYVPYEDLEKIFEDEGRGVFLPYREFLDLWNQLNLQRDEEKEKPPADGVLASANYTAVVEGDENQVLAIDAVFQVESFREKGWAVVPLIKSGLNIAEADTGDATIHLGKNGYELILPKKGQYEIKLKLYAKVQRSSGRHSVGLNLPRAGVSKFEAVLPDQGWDFEIQPGAAYSSEDLPGGETRLSFFFGETEHFDISWQKQGEETKLTPLLFVESEVNVKVIPGALQSTATLRYRILRAGVDQFVVTVPAGHEILGVTGDNIKEWDIKEPGGDQELTVSLHSAAKQEYTLTISLEQALDALPTEFDVPRVVAGDVVRQRGTVTLNNNSELEVETVSSEGLTQQSITAVQQQANAPAGLAANAMRNYGKFRYLTMPFSMSLAVKKAEPQVEVESWTRFVVEPDSARFETRFDYNVKRVGIFDTRIVIPAGFEGVEATGDNVEDFSEETADGTRTLTVKFRDRAQGKFSFDVTGRLVRADAEEDATVPVFGPQDVERHEGKIGLQIHTSLDPNTKDTGDLRQQEVSLLAPQQQREDIQSNGGRVQLSPIGNIQGAQVSVQGAAVAGNGGLISTNGSGGIPGSGALQIGFRYRGSEAAPAVIGFKLKEPQVNAEVFTLVDVREQLVRYRWTIAYNVLYAGVDTFIFSIPEDIADDLRVDGAIIKEVDKEYTPEADDPAAPQAGAGRKLWAVILRDKRMGSYELTLSLDRPLAETEVAAAAPEGNEAADESGESGDAEAGSFEIAMPEIKLEQVFRETGQVAVVKDDNLEILDAAAIALEAVDPKELRGNLARDGVLMAYKYRRHPLGLSLKISRNEFLPVPPAIVTYADLTTVISGDEAITTEAIYWVKNNGQQFLSVSLPAGGEMVSDIYVNGEPQQPMSRAGEDVVLVRLPVGGEQSGQAFPVRFVYEVPSADPGDQLGWMGSIAIDPARLTQTEVLQAQITLWLPEEYVYRSFKSAMRLPPAERGWTSFRSAFDRIIPSLGPQINPRLAQPWKSPPPRPGGSGAGFDFQIPKEGQQFHLHRLDSPSEIRVGFRSKGFAFFTEALFFLLALGVGLWLLTRPLLWRLIYFAGVGLLSMVIAGAVIPSAASFWHSIFYGVLLAALVWLGFGCLKLAGKGGGDLKAWREKRREKAAAEARERVAAAKARMGGESTKLPVAKRKDEADTDEKDSGDDQDDTGK